MKENETSLVDDCYRRIKEGIIHGEFAPGEKLRIIKLKSILDVGPTPIREALSRLAYSGLVEMEANKGFRVKKVSEAEVRDIYDTFNKIELLALNQALELGDVSWEANIMAALHKLTAFEKVVEATDLTEWLKLNHAFHYFLIAGCGSPCLLKIREELSQLFDRYCHLSLLLFDQPLQIINDDHRAIANAVIERNKTKACHLISLHFEKSFKLVMKALYGYD